jgi:hypothetical protein
MREFMLLVEGYRFFKDCVSHNDSDVGFLIDMVDSGEEITYEQFMRKVGVEQVKRVFSDYDWRPRSKGLTLKGDYHVRYFKGKYANQTVYYIVHSAIEYIFVDSNFVSPVGHYIDHDDGNF